MSSIGTKFILAQRFVFDPNNNSIIDKQEGNDLNRLGSNESRILLLFSERPNQIITRDELHEFVWRDQGFQVDDSSLTQAISTLRKVLSDSTKAPRFVKTVPKRGYQFIASVEKTTPLSSSVDVEDERSSKSESVISSENSGESPTTATLSSHSTIDEKGTNTRFKQEVLASKAVFLFALLLPIWVFVNTDPAPSKFKLIDTVGGVPIKTTENHPSLDEWQPLMHRCVTTYLSEHEEKPNEIIITSGVSNNLMLNYVHSELNTAENITIQIIAKQHEMSELCKE
jgi:cholera toxin transcriptional activator